VGFEHSEKSNDAIDMVFNKKRADDRKEWLKYYDRNSYLDTNKMGKLDVAMLRYLSPEEFRVLTAVRLELYLKNYIY
jgi:hypothetical protein